MPLTTQMIYGNTRRNSPSHLTTLILSQRFRFKNSKAGLAFLALPFVYMLSPSFRESNGSHNAIRGCSRSEVSLTSSCWTCTEKSLGKISPGFEKKTREETREISLGIAWVFYKWVLNMWSFHQWWDNEGQIFEIRVLWSNFLLEWGLGSPRLLRKHGWYLHPLHCKPQHEKWNWI